VRQTCKHWRKDPIDGKRVKLWLVEESLGLFDPVGKFYMPVTVTYDDSKKTTHPISAVLSGRVRIGERTKSKLVSSTTWKKS